MPRVVRCWRQMRARLLAPLALLAALAGAVPANAAVKIEVLSSRADLVSGGDAVVAITAKRVSKLTVRLNHRKVSKRFKRRADGRRIGLVKTPARRTQRDHGAAQERPRGAARHPQPPERRAGLLGAAGPAVEVPGEGG